MSKISKITLVLDYDLLQVTYWPPNDLFEVKIKMCHVLLHGCLNMVFWVKDFKLTLVLDYDISEATYWPPNDL